MAADMWNTDVYKEERIVVKLIRHGKTLSNIKRAYIGSTDESLSEQGIIELEQYKDLYTASKEAVIFSSPMRRCIETAEIIYPDREIRIINGLKETNFGIFEGKNYEELKDNDEYKKWISSNGEIVPYGAEKRSEVTERVCIGFETALYNILGLTKEAIFVLHGGGIMFLMEHYIKNGACYEYQVSNGDGYLMKASFEHGIKLDIIGNLLAEKAVVI